MPVHVLIHKITCNWQDQHLKAIMTLPWAGTSLPCRQHTHTQRKKKLLLPFTAWSMHWLLHCSIFDTSLLSWLMRFYHLCLNVCLWFGLNTIVPLYATHRVKSSGKVCFICPLQVIMDMFSCDHSYLEVLNVLRQAYTMHPFFILLLF